MTTTYRVLFRVAMRHAYFADGVLRELVAQPTPATAARLRRVGWLCKALPDGFAVLGAVAAPLDAPALAALSSVFPLLFSLVPRDPLFVTYSALDFVPGLTPLYRLGPVLAKPDAGRVVASAVVPLRPLLFSQPVAPAAGARTARLRGLSRGGRLLDGLPVPVRAAALPLDLRPWGSGAYQVQVGTETESFYADDELFTLQPWAVLEVSAAVLKAPPGAVYTLAFAARATF